MRRELQNLFHKTFYVIAYNQELDIVDTFWDGYASEKSLREACEAGLEVHEATKCPFKLNDNSRFTGPWSDSVAWLEKEWLPRALKAGVRFIAHVAPANSFGEVAGEVMKAGKIGEQLEVGTFYNREAALGWLKTCQKKHYAFA